MSFSDAPKLPTPATASGITMALQITNSLKKVRFTLNEAAQEKYFGGKMAMKTGKVLIGGGDDIGLAQIRLDDDADQEFKETMKGSVSFTVGHWAALPNDKRPAAPCEVVSQSEDAVTVRLPSWAKPTGAGGKLDQTAQRPVNTGGKP